MAGGAGSEGMTRYLAWDFDAGEAVEFERKGECNQCGECCRVLIRFQWCDTTGDGGRNGGNATDGKGVWEEIETPAGRRFFRLQEIQPGGGGCPQLLGNQCQEHDASDRAMCCTEWPWHPDQVKAFPGCSYTFEEINRWRFEPTEIAARQA